MVRFKTRYLLCEITFEQDLSTGKPTQFQVDDRTTQFTVLNIIKESLDVNFGDFGLGSIASSLNVKYFSPFTKLAIVRTSRDHVKMVWASITLVTSFKQTPCCIRVIHNAGTIKSAQKTAIEFDKLKIKELQQIGVVSGNSFSFFLIETIVW